MSVIPKISVKLLDHIFWMRFGLASWTRKSKTFGKIIRKMLFDGDDMVVLPKDSVSVRRTVETDISLDNAGERTILPNDVVKNVLRSTDNIFIMNFCICRRSSKCEDYPVDHGCIFVGKGIDRIPPEFGRRATSEEAVAYIDECTDLGMVHILGRNKMDSIWLNTGDKDDLMTICNCCPCCCLWNIIADISDDIASNFRRMEGVSVDFNPESCVGCGMCTESCFANAVRIVDGKCSIDQKICRACGRCSEMCPHDAITISYDEEGVLSEMERMGSILEISDRKA